MAKSKSEHPQRLRIRIPPVHAPWVGSSSKHVALEHASLDCKAPETALALAFALGGTVLLVSQQIEYLKHLARSWLDGTHGPRAAKLSAGNLHGYQIGRSCVWIGPGEIDRKLLPFSRARALIVAGASEVATSPIDSMRRYVDGRIVAVGRFAYRGHWFYEFARAERTELHRMTAEQIVDAFPDQAAQVFSERDARYQREMLLEDVPVRVQPFSIFCRERLRVRTDKRVEVLHPYQQEVALRELGGQQRGNRALIVPLVEFPIQRKIRAMKRLGRARGYSRFILLKYRRAGATVFEQATSYELCVRNPGTYAVSLADTEDKAKRIFAIAKMFQERDPKAPRLITKSKTALGFENGSVFFTGTGGGKGAGRGDQLQRAHCSEVPYWCQGPRQVQRVEEAMTGLLEATGHGEVVAEGTPNGREWFYQTWREAKSGRSEWWPIFLRWFDDPLNFEPEETFDPGEIQDTLTAREKDLIDEHDLSLAQVAFRRRKWRELPRLAVQEYPEDDETAFITSGTCYFDVPTVVALLEAMPDYPRKHIPGGYEVRWKAPEKGRQYVAGCDTSEGLAGCDPNGVGILDKKTGEQVAAVHGLFSPKVLAEHAVRLCRDYNDALLGVERENHGHAVLLKVQELGYRRSHHHGGPLYYFGATAKSAKPGWSTNRQTRPVMIEDLAEAVGEGAMIVRDRDFLGECLAFRLQSNGKFEADPGEHDDSVMKWAVAWQMRKHRRRKPKISFGPSPV